MLSKKLIKKIESITLDSVTDDMKQLVIRRMASIYTRVVSINEMLEERGEKKRIRIVDVLDKIKVDNIFRLIVALSFKDDNMICKMFELTGDTFNRTVLEGLNEYTYKKDIEKIHESMLMEQVHLG